MIDSNHEIPSGARAAARILLLSGLHRLLLLKARSADGDSFWLTPGGGLEPGENFEAAARRELREETGLALPLGPCVWTRHHLGCWEGRPIDQYERFFVVWSPSERIAAVNADSYVVDHRWWSLREIETSSEQFAPRRLSRFLPAILRGEYPNPAIDCGV